MAVYLSKIWETVDRSVYEKIRLLLVAAGYLPDITLFTDDDAGVLAYSVEMEAIKVAKGFAIEIFGQGSNLKRYEKKVPRIVYSARRIFPGDIGGNPEYTYTKAGSVYNAEAVPPMSSSLQFEISLVYKTAEQERLLNAIIQATLKSRSYIPHYDNPSEQFFITNISYRDNPDTAFGITEKILTYQANDLWDDTQEVLFTVSPLKSVELETKEADSGKSLGTITIQ